ncbi:hypothetical protein CEK28_14710 [Xenophilus sp. AP218F]|nr:hypothetical protein CEK28_14710 [Xenophilus sp. AP218F]
MYFMLLLMMMQMVTGLCEIFHVQTGARVLTCRWQAEPGFGRRLEPMGFEMCFLTKQSYSKRIV